MFGILFAAPTKFGEENFRRAGMDPSKYEVDQVTNVNSHLNFQIFHTSMPKGALVILTHLIIKKKIN